MTFNPLDPRWTALPGWCGPAKAVALYRLVQHIQPSLVVELGVYGGRSAIPMALALRDFDGKGRLYAVDPYSSVDAYENNAGNPDAWVKDFDFAPIRRAFLAALDEFDVTFCVNFVPVTSHAAVKYIYRGAIDLLHIDANHSEPNSLQDVHEWLPRVRPGGYVWFDDNDRPTTQKALAYLDENCLKLFDVDNSTLFWKPITLPDLA